MRTSVRGGPALSRALRDLAGEAPKALGGALYEEATEILGASQELVPVDMGPLRNSGHVTTPEIKGTTVEVAVGYGGAAAPYALYVHEGTGPAVGRPPFMPPVELIEAWAKRKGIPIGTGKDQVSAFVLARSIGSRGIKPRKFLETPFVAAEDGMERRLVRRMQRFAR